MGLTYWMVLAICSRTNSVIILSSDKVQITNGKVSSWQRAVAAQKLVRHRLRPGRVGTQPEAQMGAFFDPEALCPRDVFIGIHAVVKLYVGIVGAMHDQGRTTHLLDGHMGQLLKERHVVVVAWQSRLVGGEGCHQATGERQRLRRAQREVNMRLKLPPVIVGDASKHLLEEPCRFLLADQPHEILSWLAHKNRLGYWASRFRHVVAAAYTIYRYQCP